MSQTTDEAEIKATPAKKDAPKKREITNEDVCSKVVAKLGTPPNFYRCTATNIPNSCNYRVNVWIKEDYSTGHITDSFFIKVDEEGEILSPAIKRKYPSIHKA